MKKYIFLFLLINIISLALEINDIRFDKVIPLNEKVSKTFLLNNSGEKELLYRLSIEGDKNIKVHPKNINLKSREKKNFIIEVEGTTQGKKEYYLVFDEKIIDKENKNSGLSMNKKIKILQKYEVK